MGFPTGPHAHESCHHSRWLNEGPRLWRRVFHCRSQSRPGVDRLATPLRIDESLTFRAFDKTIIFGHWLLKTQKLALASRASLLKKDFYDILVYHFQKSKNKISKNPFPKRWLWGTFTWGFFTFLTCKHRVAKFNFRYTFIRFPYIYIYIYICCALKKYFPFIKNCITYTPVRCKTASAQYRSFIVKWWEEYRPQGLVTYFWQIPKLF